MYYCTIIFGLRRSKLKLNSDIINDDIIIVVLRIIYFDDLVNYCH